MATANETELKTVDDDDDDKDHDDDNDDDDDDNIVNGLLTTPSTPKEQKLLKEILRLKRIVKKLLNDKSQLTNQLDDSRLQYEELRKQFYQVCTDNHLLSQSLSDVCELLSKANVHKDLIEHLQNVNISPSTEAVALSQTELPDKLPKSFSDAFQGIRSQLECKLDTRGGLLNELLKRGVLLKPHVANIESHGTNDFKRADKLMKLLDRRDDAMVSEFCQSLLITGQHDIFQLVTRHEICSPYHINDRLVRLTDTERRCVSGITILDDLMYVVYERSNVINVYLTQHPYTLIKPIYLSVLKYPFDITASVISRCLFIADPRSAAVWRMKVDDGKIDKWLSVRGVGKVSLTSDDRLVLLVVVNVQSEESSKTWHGEVHIYNASGVSETVIKLSNYIVNPHHAVMTSRNTLVISYGDHMTKMNRICELNVQNGMTLKAFGDKRGRGVNQLNFPAHLSLTDDERILVADCYNNRLLMLDSQLCQVERELIQWTRTGHEDDVCGPLRTFYCRKTRQLFVGLITGHVDVYQLR